MTKPSDKKEEKVQISLFVPMDLKVQMSIYCTKHRINQTTLINMALERFLGIVESNDGSSHEG